MLCVACIQKTSYTMAQQGHHTGKNYKSCHQASLVHMWMIPKHGHYTKGTHNARCWSATDAYWTSRYNGMTSMQSSNASNQDKGWHNSIIWDTNLVSSATSAEYKASWLKQYSSEKWKADTKRQAKKSMGVRHSGVVQQRSTRVNWSHLKRTGCVKL